MELIQTRSNKFNLKWAIIAFILAYIVITILAVGLYYAIAVPMGISLTAEFNLRKDAAYLLAEKIYPLLNMLVWASFSWMYFKQSNTQNTWKQAWMLGGFWLAIVLPLDYVSFVAVTNPLSLSAYDFYIAQFPWIYLTYLAVLISPAIYIACVKKINQ